MAFKGITFAGQNVTPKNDGGLYQAHYGDGVLWGCSMAISGDDLVIQSGEFIAGGRVCFVDGATNVDLSGRLLSTGYARVIMNYDLTQGEGSQWYTTFDESASTTFPALTQDDINSTGDLYQIQLAMIQISGGNLTTISGILPMSPVVFYNSNGDIQGKIRLTSTNMAFVGGEDANGFVTAGLRTGIDETILSADGKSIEFHPNGMYSSSGQATLDTTGKLTVPSFATTSSSAVTGDLTVSGQIKGGLTISGDTYTNVSCSANANTTVKTISSLDSNGVYLVFGEVTFTMTGSQTGGLYMNWYRSNGTAITYDLKSFVNRGEPVFSSAVWVRGSTSVRLAIEPSIAGSAKGYIDVIRIG